MRRSTALGLVILALIAGVLTNFGICWYASWTGVQSAGRHRLVPGYYLVPLSARKQWTFHSASESAIDGWSRFFAGDYGERELPPQLTPYGLRWTQSNGEMYGEAQFGWPYRGMWRYGSDLPLTHDSFLERLLVRNPPPPPSTGMESYGVLFPDSLRIPLRFIPSGFALNTVFWSSVWLAAALAEFFARRFRRACRGLCTRCGYSRAGLASPATPCPECGAAAVGGRATDRRPGRSVT